MIPASTKRSRATRPYPTMRPVVRTRYASAIISRSWAYTRTVLPGSFATSDFDFEKPRKSLAGSATIAREHQQSTYEVFDYPGELSQLDSQQSDLTANVRIQELQASYMIASGQGKRRRSLATGLRFTLDKYPRKDLNIAYVITRATYTLNADSYEPGPGEPGEEPIIRGSRCRPEGESRKMLACTSGPRGARASR